MTVGLLSLLLIAVAGLVDAAETEGERANPAVVHFAFAKSLFVGVNENDARASVRVYSRTIGDENGIPTGAGPLILEGTDAMAKALQLNEIDLLSLTAEEFFAVEDHGLVGPLLLTSVNRLFTEDYLLLVREASAIRKVEDLRGCSLIIPGDNRASLARIWLDVLCTEHGLGPAGLTLTNITTASKTMQVVLPVFFGKTDACIVTRNGWEVMGELTPQVKTQLRIIAVSEPVVPVITCFRRGLSEALKQKIIDAAEGSFAKQSFRQLMALFKTEGLVHRPVSSLESTRELVAAYRRLRAGTNQAKIGLPEPVLSKQRAD